MHISERCHSLTFSDLLQSNGVTHTGHITCFHFLSSAPSYRHCVRLDFEEHSGVIRSRCEITADLGTRAVRQPIASIQLHIKPFSMLLRAVTSQLCALVQQAGGALAAQHAVGGAVSLQARRGFNFVPYVIESTSRGALHGSALTAETKQAAAKAQQRHSVSLCSAHTARVAPSTPRQASAPLTFTRGCCVRGSYV
jgi:hypothetical protein